MADMLVRKLDLRADLSAEDGGLTVYRLPQPIASALDIDIGAYRNGLGAGEPAPAVPAGRYLFTQLRGAPDAEALAEEALEQQKEGLWSGAALGETLYLRVLAEEGGAVRQLIRALRRDGAE